ncbi:hypothetical protein SAMD00019534_066740 [Acytostelium subglobosum LB1]|uniref:hypothetical protein n=1 Tax=Acytostelium subglobosum LB1 TaxID=1410327 RepID=UPI000645152F|nr:hypothetical protein SAMD00019534_066740 [Acytostelium subglobosum LB1]GAM23499.1 hypothetical protein SAMD00019534_066740 [Acytostelium subglobosum LB1]|eukprot:XP_012753240.1 hypothetical protein SAMD00019534_066740 [Acytostelium subglobosum LB1]
MDVDSRSTYVSQNGTVTKKTFWSIKTIREYFWFILNQILAFFHTLVSDPATEKYKNKGRGGSDGFGGYGGGGGGGGGGYGRGGGAGGGGGRMGTMKSIQTHIASCTVRSG